MEQEEKERFNAIYVRVNKSSTKEDAMKDIDTIREYMLKNGISSKYEFYDKTSSFALNEESRVGLYQLMDLVIKGMIDNIYVFSSDNVSPVAFPIIKWLCLKYGTRINCIAESSQKAAEKSEIYSELAFFSKKMLSKYGVYGKK